MVKPGSVSSSIFPTDSPFRLFANGSDSTGSDDGARKPEASRIRSPRGMAARLEPADGGRLFPLGASHPVPCRAANLAGCHPRLAAGRHPVVGLPRAVVRHAECLALKLGEPVGTLILTLSVIGIEVMMISRLDVDRRRQPHPGAQRHVFRGDDRAQRPGGPVTRPRRPALPGANQERSCRAPGCISP